MGLLEQTIFAGLTLEDREVMARCFHASTWRYQAGEEICSYGQQNPHQVGILCSGRAVIQRIEEDGRRTVLEFLEEPDVFGEELAFAGSRDDQVSVVCMKPCQVMFFDYDQIVSPCSNACPRHSTLIRNLMNLLAEKAFRLSQRVEILTHRSIRGKLMCCFSLFAGKKGEPSFLLPFTLSGLAEYIAADRSAMMRELKRMKEEGLLQLEGRRVTLAQETGTSHQHIPL